MAEYDQTKGRPGKTGYPGTGDALLICGDQRNQFIATL